MATNLNKNNNSGITPRNKPAVGEIGYISAGTGFSAFGGSVSFAELLECENNNPELCAFVLEELQTQSTHQRKLETWREKRNIVISILLVIAVLVFLILNSNSSLLRDINATVVKLIGGAGLVSLAALLFRRRRNALARWILSDQEKHRGNDKADTDKKSEDGL